MSLNISIKHSLFLESESSTEDTGARVLKLLASMITLESSCVL